MLDQMCLVDYGRRHYLKLLPLNHRYDQKGQVRPCEELHLLQPHLERRLIPQTLITTFEIWVLPNNCATHA